MFKIRKSQDRGFFNHGWLQTFHTFSFGNYYDENNMNFGNLRVINEDVIQGGKGFGKHPHRDMEIITYIISGALEHQDSMGNSSKILPNEVQFMSAGSGVFHSEFNPLENQETHILQIWILPKEKNIAPKYGQKSFAKDFARNELVLVLSGSGRDGSIQINQDAEIYAAKINEEKTINFEIKGKNKVWIQLISGNLSVNDLQLEKGDGLSVSNETSLVLKAEKNCEFLLFDLS